jgi:hypothetical protein
MKRLFYILLRKFFPAVYSGIRFSEILTEEIIVRNVTVDLSKSTINVGFWEDRIKAAATSRFPSLRFFTLRYQILDLNMYADSPRLSLAKRDANAVIITRLLTNLTETQKAITTDARTYSEALLN